LAWAELGATFPHAGGEYVYLREAFGLFWGFLSGWAAFLASFCGSIAVLAIALAEYLISVLSLGSPETELWSVSLFGGKFALLWGPTLGIILIWIVTLLNYCGLRLGSLTQNILSLGKLIAIGVLLVVGFSLGTGTWAHFVPLWTGEQSAHNFPSALGLALIPVAFTYSGWNAAAYVAHEVDTPEENLPKALALGTVITLAVYLALNVLYLYAVPVGQLSGVVRVGEHVSGALFGPGAAWVISLLIAISIASAFNVMVLTGGRIYFAMARDGVFFAPAAKLHPRFHVPGNALLMQAVWTSVLILSGTFAQLLTYSTVVLVAVSVITVGAIFVLRRRQPNLPRPYHAWGYPWVPVLYMLASIGIVLNALWEQPVESFLGIGLCLAGVPAYWWWRLVDTRTSKA
jgi:APA family basic amino acid/polyamine antiporter